MRGLLLVTCVLLASCSSVDVGNYAERQPVFLPETFFAGSLKAYGVVKNYQGYASRSFVADIDACWKDGVGTLDESFLFDNGEPQTRVWSLSKNGDGSTYSATAGDVRGVGTAAVSGNAMFLDYVLTIALEDGSIDVSVDDRMYLVDDNVLINESVMRKFGVPVGEILLTIIRYPDVEVSCPE